MGQNRRYGSDVSRAKIAAAALRPQPLTLTAAQVGEPVTNSPTPIPVVAWVPFRERSVELDAYAIAWTPRGVRVKFQLEGADHEVWVWASAVRRRQRDRD